MADVTVIGRGANVVGTVSGDVDLTIYGRVEGAVSVGGDVTVEAEGLVAASVTGRHVVVRGAIKGDVTAEDAIRLEEGARVVGDLRAPRVAVTRGALVRGFVQTNGASHPETRTRAPAKAARPEPTALPRMAAPRVAPAPDSGAVSAAARKGAHAPTLLAGAAPKPKGPPSPVVPALRKGAKGALKKRVG